MKEHRRHHADIGSGSGGQEQNQAGNVSMTSSKNVTPPPSSLQKCKTANEDSRRLEVQRSYSRDEPLSGKRRKTIKV